MAAAIGSAVGAGHAGLSQPPGHSADLALFWSGWSAAFAVMLFAASCRRRP
jgi:hypothetical protein